VTPVVEHGAPARGLMVGTGEYTTGYVHDGASGSDKSAGMVALTLFDLRRTGRVGELLMAGTNGTKFPGIRAHLKRAIGDRYRGLDVSFASYPADDVGRDPRAYMAALAQLDAGDFVIIFTPDDTHFPIAMAAIERGMHVLVTKPIVKTLAEHRQLAAAAATQGVLVAVEVHKRWDPMYADARERMQTLGGFSHFVSHMTQPKFQLETFRAWAGRSSDINYYLNSHHVDFLVWSVQNQSRPVSVTALAADGVARALDIDTEDTITLAVQWQNDDGAHATSVHTASWIAPKSDVHSQQRFFYMGHAGEIQVDQAHRGFSLASDDAGLAAPNPYYIRYTPDALGRFAGQLGYGYRCIESFVDAVGEIRAGRRTPRSFDGTLATVHDTPTVTAILEAGRRSLDAAGAMVRIATDASGVATALEG
jgi:D-galacturonate reductase